MAEPTIGPDELHRFLIGAIKQIQAIPLASYEELRADRGVLLESVASLVGVSLEILGVVAHHYEHVADGAKTREVEIKPGRLCVEVDRRMEVAREASDIADLAFVARLGLKGRLEALGALDRDDPRWDIIDQAGSACREMLKSLSAIEKAVSELEGLPSDNTYYESGISTALATRRTYALFARDVKRDGTPSEAELVQRLRLVATAIAKLTGRDVYPNLRVADRIQFRSLQERILEWLREGDTGSLAMRAGLRIWQDVEAFAGLLRQINNRAELRTHDGECLGRVVGMLELAGSGSVPDSAFTEMAALRGLDDTLDDIIARVEPTTAGACLTLLRELRERVVQAAAPPRATEVIDPTSIEGDFF